MFTQSMIAFIGGGNMGEALIKGLLAASLLKSSQIRVFDVSVERVQYLSSTYKIVACSNAADAIHEADLVVLAVKPQTMSAVLEEIHQRVLHRPLVISIAAGITLKTLEQTLPEGTPVVRVMPNTPALVQEGAAALTRGASVNDSQMRRALVLLQAVGTAIEVEEKCMDAVTGLSGSGPGFVLLLIESLIDAGVLVGLPRQVSRQLTLQTMLGTVKLVQETQKHPAELKDLITSPAGTTIRGLQVLEDRGVRGALLAAVEDAARRSMELGRK
jgi:pyrroline-5-carboxylate reductase